MLFTKLAVCILWYFLVPVVGALYICEGPNDLAAEWPTEQELRNFNETTEGRQNRIIFSSIHLFLCSLGIIYCKICTLPKNI